MKIEITEPVVGADGEDQHPSFGVVRLSRRTCRPPRRLFDSSISHGEYVHLEIARATRRRDLHHDYIYGAADTLIEVDMSLMQWGALVSSFNQGSGTPVTLSRVGRETMPEAAHQSRLAKSAQEVADKARKSTADVQLAVDAVVAAFQERAGRRDMGVVLDRLRSVVGNLPGNMQFAADALTEHAEDVVSKAKADIEATIQYGGGVLAAGDRTLELTEPATHDGPRRTVDAPAVHGGGRVVAE